MEIQRIVAGLAPGPLSDGAVARAAELARKLGARLEVVHGAGVEAPHLGAARKSFLAGRREQSLSRARESARSRLEPLLAPHDLSAADVLRVEPGSGAHALLERARAGPADLVVLGAHRHRRPLDVGGTSRAVVARSPCPVWIEPTAPAPTDIAPAPTDIAPAPIRRLLAPVDLSPSSALVLRTAAALGARLGAPVRVLHVFVPPEFAYEPGEAARGPTYVVDDLRQQEHAATHELVASFDWGALPPETDFAEGEPSEIIVEHSRPGDLVVMGTHGHTGLARAVLGSCAHRVLKHAREPLLVVPQHGSQYAEG